MKVNSGARIIETLAQQLFESFLTLLQTSVENFKLKNSVLCNVDMNFWNYHSKIFFLKLRWHWQIFASHQTPCENVTKFEFTLICNSLKSLMIIISLKCWFNVIYELLWIHDVIWICIVTDIIRSQTLLFVMETEIIWFPS